MEKQNILIFGVIFLIGIMFVNLVGAEMLISPANVSYDSQILEQFRSSNEVNIFFELNNFSDADNLFSTLSNDTQNFKEINKWPYSPTIDVKITLGGFSKLISDSRIKVIYFNAPAHAINNSSCGDGSCNNGENCTSCVADCGNCKEIVSPINNLWFWITIPVIIILIIGIFLLKKRKK